MPTPRQPNLEITQLLIYPIKGCRGISQSQLGFDENGILYDRNWGIANSAGKIITQRERPELSLIQTELESNGTPKLKLSAPQMTPVEFELFAESKSQTVSVFDQECEAWLESEKAALWLSDYLKDDLRLVRVNKAESRPVDKKSDNSTVTNIAFQDGFPVLLISEASLDDLNTKLASKIKMNRFRPNIVVKGCAPYEEDNWRQIKIGEQQLDFVKRCARCVVTTVDQETAEKGSEPLKTLSRERRVDNKILFGNYAVHQNLENITVQDSPKVLL